MTRKCSCRPSRRTFLKGSGLTLAGFGLSSLFPEAIIRQAMAAGPTTDNRFLFIFLRGGNDGLNAVIPHGDPDYSAVNRPGVYVAPGDAIDLNGFASFHPALADMMPAYTAGDMAVIHRIGYPNSSRSHFDGQRIWENGNPSNQNSFNGWLARTLFINGFSGGSLVPVLTAQPTQPVLVRGGDEYLNVADPDNFNFSLPFLGEPLRTKVVQAWPAHHADLSGLEPYGETIADIGLQLASFVDEFDAWDQAGWDPKDPDDTTLSLFPVSFETNPDDPSSPSGKRFPEESYDFFRNLKLCALAFLESDPLSNNNGTRVAGTELQGWDLHSGQGGAVGRHASLLEMLAYGMRSLRIALSGAAVDPRGYGSVWDKTVVATMSEFGRTGAANGSGGTDHGAGSCSWIQGGSISGGVYNCDSSNWPSGVIFGDGGRDLAVETDYRSVFWEIMRDHMGADPAGADTVFPGYTAQGLATQELGLFST